MSATEIQMTMKVYIGTDEAATQVRCGMMSNVNGEVGFCKDSVMPQEEGARDAYLHHSHGQWHCMLTVTSQQRIPFMHK
ncbi:hypothetical protein GBA52_014656 [Prunus armeniaca]|nr:hypothetical protein GBA52_014656 [Prunus armeniaca]